MPAAKIASGKYTPPMVEYNMRQQIEKWLTNIYNEYYQNLSKTN